MGTDAQPQDPYENNPSGDLLASGGIDDEFLGRLHRRVDADLKALDTFRGNILAITEQQVGSYYGEGGLAYEVPLPLVQTFLSIHSRALVPKEPRVSLSTFDEPSIPAVDAMMNWQNDWIEDQGFADTFRRVVHDGLISEGHLKVSLLMPEVAEAGYGLEANQPHFCHVHEEDWVEDMKARSAKDRTYYGHKYSVPLEVARDILDKDLHATEPSDYQRGLQKIWTLSAGTNRREDIEDFVDLWEVHLVRKGLVVTLKDDNGLPGNTKKHVLRVRKYIGPRGGNCLTLGYNTVSGNLRHLSPCMILLPLHLAANRSYRKCIDTADNYKAVAPIRGGAMSADGKAIKEANHMEMVACDNPGEVKEVRFNLPPAELQLFVTDLRSAFDFMAGGLATLGGRSPMAGTATQEKILANNAGAGVADMAATTTKFMSDAFKILNWYLWYHPTNEYQSRKQVPGTNEFFSRTLHPYNDELPSHRALVDAQALMRRGPMPRIKVDPYSLVHMTPQEKSQFVTQVMAEAAPYAAIMAGQGVYPDMAEWMDLKSIFGDIPELRKVWKFRGKPAPEGDQNAQGQGGEPPGLNKEISAKPAQTERTYNRISSGGGQRDQAAQMRTQLMASMNGEGPGP